MWLKRWSESIMALCDVCAQRETPAWGHQPSNGAHGVDGRPKKLAIPRVVSIHTCSFS